MNNLSFQYPTWYLLFCLLAGLAYALILYYRDSTFRELSSRLNLLLGTLRFLTVSALAALLLSPLLKSAEIDTQKPVVILAQDESESVLSGFSEADRTSYQSQFQGLSESLSDKFEVKQYAFGSSVREEIPFSFEDKITNISDFLGDIYDLYTNQNLGAIVMATDGIYNEGSNPIYSSSKLAVPIYTVALGDTTPKRDIILKRVFHNKIAYLGDKFSIQIDVAGQNAAGSNTTLTVYKVQNGNLRKLQEQVLSIDKNDYFHTEELILDADEAGVQRYRIALSPIPDEVTTGNNSKDIFIDVLDARQKILVVGNSPHPDLTALKQQITLNKNYQVEIAYIENFSKQLADYDMLILHQLPSVRNEARVILDEAKNRKIPIFFIVGSQTNLNALNRIQQMVTIRRSAPTANEVQGRLAPNFNLFTTSEDFARELSVFPPLTAPFGDFNVEADGQVFLYQRIGRIDTRFPLLIMGESEGQRQGVLCAEGIWKWRLFDYLQHQNHEVFNELISKSVQYISVKEDKRRFRVSLSKNIFNENEQVLFDAELYNSSYELVNEPDVSMVITDGSGKEFNFVFNKTGRAYSLNAGFLPVGNYNYKANVFSNGENLSFSGQFSVEPIQLEVYETAADHGLLRLLSEKFGGQMVYPAQLSSVNDLLEQQNIKPIIYETSKTRSVINLKWIFFLLLGLLSAEWVLRRYFGAY
ncbi:MAG: hypothetical protein F6K19_18995 [Cyanothece sp. SIO1E1]|nr:hypothetical protein [Cyanothece sp. SIO1E1]